MLWTLILNKGGKKMNYIVDPADRFEISFCKCGCHGEGGNCGCDGGASNSSGNSSTGQ